MVKFSLNSSELKDLKNRIIQLSDSIMDRRETLIFNSQVSPENDSKISDLVSNLNSSINQIAIRQIEEIRTDLEEPKKRIEKVTEELQSAIQELEDSKKVLRVLTGFVNLVGAILNPASGGLVKIAAVVNQLDSLT